MTNCLNCGKIFSSHNPNPKYCSIDCKANYNSDKVDLEKLKILYGEGKTQTEIAILMGTSQKVIYTRMKKHNISARVAFKRDQRGPKNDSWKGEGAKYKAFHARLYRLYGDIKKCDFCETEDKTLRYEWASLSKNYGDISDYARMCKRCHSTYDSIHKNFTKGEVYVPK